MQYTITFLEGVIAFISPCCLPMISIYLSYFAGGGTDRDTKRTLLCAFGFITGFTIIFVMLGAFAGFLGGLVVRYQTAVNIVAGSIVVLFGLNYLGVLKIGFLNKAHAGAIGTRKVSGFFPAVLFGIVFSISWTPCVGAFLASALAKASQQGSMAEGIFMLFTFAMGLGIPFLLSAVLIDKLKSAFDWIKKHYKVINLAAGLFLVVIGVTMMTGLMNRFMALLV